MQSLSLRERGLKCKIFAVQMRSEAVALLARAWIEIQKLSLFIKKAGVALLARAWIEILSRIDCFGRTGVALLARAWIEILRVAP